MYATLSGSDVISLKTSFLMSCINKFPFKEIYLAVNANLVWMLSF
jgi:hypothetical protein